MNSDNRDPAIIRIMVRGMKIGIPHHDFHSSHGLVRFALAENSSIDQPMHAALFVNNEAYSDVVLQWPRERRICALVESPINPCFRDTAELERRFPLILTHRQELVRKGPPYKQLLFGTSWIGLSSEEEVDRIRTEHPPKSKSVSFIGSIQHPSTGAYQFRREVANAVLGRPDVDCFGKGIREIAGKREALAPYRFSIAMENAAEDLYFTEKLIDCILLETIPIYYGCNGISELFNPAGVLQFRSLEELDQLLNTLSDSLWTERRSAALENKKQVLDRGWYSHRSLLDRIGTELLHSIPLQVLSTTWQASGKLSRWKARLSNHVLSLLRWK